MLAATFSALHLLALAFGLAAIWSRGRALRALAHDPSAIRRVLAADNLWGIAALVWIGTGLTRVLAGLDKTTAFYVHNGLFWVKMALLGLILVLELWPMVTLIRWRIAQMRGQPLDTRPAAALARISAFQTALVVGTVVVASMMARGLWLLG